MQKLLRRIKNKKGFTLMEMLIVVAIIVILVAVSVPVFTSQLNEAKTTTDTANMRAARSVALTTYMTNGKVGSADFVAGTEYFYDAANGVLTTSKPAGYGKSSDNNNKVIAISVAADGTITAGWEE